MLIIDQTRQLAVNSEQFVTLYIEKRTCSIKARLAVGGEGGGAVVTLGSYLNIDICNKVFSYLCKRAINSYHYYELPATKEEIDFYNTQ